MTFLRCLRCVMPNTRPDTPFVDGVCAACLSFERRPTIDWKARHEELISLIGRHAGRCIVPSSGGKDSTYQVMTLLELGAHPLIVTASTCHLTEIGRHNIDNLSRYAPTIEVTPNRTVRAKLNRLGLEMVGDISWPEHAGIFSTPFKIAGATGTALMFYGENPQDQYGGPLGTEDAREMTRRWTTEFGGFLGLRPNDFVGVEGITGLDMSMYQFPSGSEMDDIGIEAHFLGQYIEWDSERNARVAMDAGMKVGTPSDANWWPAENLDNAQTGIHDWFGYLKYGYGRACAQVSVDVRHGRMSRDQALKLVQFRDGNFPMVYGDVPIEEVLHHIRMNREHFIEVANEYLNRDLFDGDVEWGERPRLKS